MSKTWIKLHTEIIGDPKIKRIQKKIPEAFEIWIKLLLMAARANLDGVIGITKHVPFDFEEIVEEIGIEAKKIDVFLQKAIFFNMISVKNNFILIKNWNKFGERESEDV